MLLGGYAIENPYQFLRAHWKQKNRSAQCAHFLAEQNTVTENIIIADGSLGPLACATALAAWLETRNESGLRAATALLREAVAADDIDLVYDLEDEIAMVLAKSEHSLTYEPGGTIRFQAAEDG